MGRLGPLTSQALGRSPYDDVVQGEGEPDTRAPQQQYDERGRPINPETRRINRDVIRSHNEVMLVIGVAEPENGIPDVQVDAARKRTEYEDEIGMKLFWASDVLETAGVWGVNGMRQRILLYRQYAETPFREMYRLNRSRQSISSYFFSGLPSFLVSNAIERAPIPAMRLRPLVKSLALYVGLHLDIFTFMQRVGLAPSTTILPNWKFFIPGSSLSPIFIPPFPSSVSAGSVLRWLGACVMGSAPFAGFYVLTRISKWVTVAVCSLVLQQLPYPHNTKQENLPKHTPQPQPTDMAMHSSSAGTILEEDPRNGRDIAREEPTFQVSEGQPQNEPHSVGAQRRQSTISVRGDEFASDDEETEVVSATLISFDVEATESTDTTPGVWSAELRPNLADSKASAGREPMYRQTALYRLPPILGADAIGVPLTRILLAPFESRMLLGLARLLLNRRGLSLEPLNGFGILQAFSWRRMVNVLGFELIFMIMQCEVHAVMMTIAELHRHTDEEWEKRVEEERSTPGS